MTVETVYHRPGAIWPFTVVGRPPQEDTTFGELIHELTGPVIPTVIPGLHAVHAVDAAGVHPLLLALGSERYVPYAAERTPQASRPERTRCRRRPSAWCWMPSRRRWHAFLGPMPVTGSSTARCQPTSRSRGWRAWA